MYRADAHEDRSLLLFGYAHHITAYHRETGEVAWTFSHDDAGGAFVDFAISEGRVYVAVGKSLVCLTHKTGVVVGTSPLPSRIERVLFDDGRLYAFGDDAVFCLDRDGRILWQRPQKVRINGYP